MNKKQIEALADADYDAMIERTGGNRNVKFLIGGVSEMLGIMISDHDMTYDEIVMFRDEMNAMINRMLVDL